MLGNIFDFTDLVNNAGKRNITIFAHYHLYNVNLCKSLRDDLTAIRKAGEEVGTLRQYPGISILQLNFNITFFCLINKELLKNRIPVNKISKGQEYPACV